jgi:SH3 domain-containing YSC84-like protein 1
MFRSLAVGTVLAAGLATSALAASSQQQLIDAAALTVEHVQSSTDPGAGKVRDYIRRARAVLIVPQLVKGGFFVGAQGGNGVLIPHGKDGWGDPGFYAMGAASFGLQIGVEVSEIVLIIMNDKALRAVTRNQFKVGAEAGIAVATLGAGAEANTTSNAGADIYGFAISKGLFGGIAVEGGIIHPRDGWASSYYGGQHTSASVVRKDGVSNPGDGALRQSLGAL